MIVMNTEITGLKEALYQFDGQNIKRGLEIGLDKVGNSVRTLASTRIREEYNLKKSDVDKSFSIQSTDERVVIACTGRPLNLTLFGARQYGSVGGRRVTVRRKGDELKTSVRGKAGSFGGVAVQITKSSTTMLPGAFLAKVKAGSKGGSNIGVFIRTGHDATSPYVDRHTRKTTRPYNKIARAAAPTHREQIINKAMVTVPTLFTGKRVMPSIQEYLTSGKPVATIEHEIEQAMKRASGVGPSGP